MLLDARNVSRQSQRSASATAGISQSMWSLLERGKGAHATLATCNRAAMAVNTSLAAYLRATSAADGPRDAVHLRHQELILRTAAPGGWSGLPEAQLDPDPRASRSGDVLLQRRLEFALADVWDWFDDVGAALRSWPRRLDAVERYAIARMAGDQPLPIVSGCWVVRATRRNKRLVADHASSSAPASPAQAAPGSRPSATRPCPCQRLPALLWVTVNGERIYPARL